MRSIINNVGAPFRAGLLSLAESTHALAHSPDVQRITFKANDIKSCSMTHVRRFHFLLLIIFLSYGLV